MEKSLRLSFPSLGRTYFLLTKPGIIMGNTVNATAGFALASRGQVNLWLLFATLVGLALVIASGCIFNNYIDREPDKKMERTKNRALPQGVISPRAAVIFAMISALLGGATLFLFTNPLTTLIALFGLFVYVLVYSLAKYRTRHGTLIGSIAGAVPPLVGYCAVSDYLGLGALILFAMIVLWQMAHFFAIAIYRLEEYAAAGIPVLPIKKGIRATKIQILVYVIAFMGTSFLLTFFHYTGYSYLVVVALLSLVWVRLCIKGFRCTSDRAWARKIFVFSLVVVMALCIMIPISVL